MGQARVNIIPAETGYITVYDFGGIIDVDTSEQVIAWRIETIEDMKSNRLSSSIMPIVVGGDVPDNCIGIQYPNGCISTFDGSSYSSLSKLKMTLEQ
ncbi:MAG: hypothetical protein R3Y10_12890 [Ferrimonas sp.]